ncbi:MAG: DAK2 domain-containing protein [Oscillospiraceae bacterium]|nr:DAK2 domain-containing protein [Oscillospiraceae bacterium]
MIERADGLLFARMVTAGAAAIEAQRQPVNELNVFPVPDGDTGTNMSLSLGAAAAELRRREHRGVGEAAEAAAQALLRGARGNSGVILSLLFRGLARGLKELEEMDGAAWAAALQNGVEVAYRAVMKPAEGTMLTVSRVAAVRALAAAENDPALESVMVETLDAAEAALAETIHQNPVLEKAGVIDAGGKGFCIILDSMLAVLQGRETAAQPAVDGQAPRAKADFSEYVAEDIKFDYCTEFIVTRRDKKDPLRLRAFLGALGDSLVLVDDEALIKVHVHTNHPGRAIEEALTYGPLTALKIENMREQHTQKVIQQDANGAEAARAAGRVIAPPDRRYGFVAVCAGAGLSAVFRDLGADQIVSGGQTMNPSTEDLLLAIDATPAEVVYVLPNNKNVIMAAEQCRPLSEKQVIVLPTKTTPQGVAALLAFEPTGDTEGNREAMLAALSGVRTGQVTYAARDSSFDGHKIASGDHMALVDEGLLYNHPDRIQVLRRLAQELGRGAPAFVTVFYGEGVDEAETAEAEAVFAEFCAGAEIQLVNGGQPVYFYLVSAE